MQQAPIQPLDYPLHILLTLTLTIALGWPIEALLHAIGKKIEIPRPNRIPESEWKELTMIPGRPGGRWIGHIERFLFFVSIITGVPELTVAWLAFKVASKWEAWGNVYKIPPKLHRATEFEFFLARTRWGSRTFQRSVVGTGANLAAAFIGVGLFHLSIRLGLWL